MNRHQPDTMAECYHPQAHFSDIAFNLVGKEQIYGMWRMICSGDIQAHFTIKHVDNSAAIVDAVDEYTFRETGRRVRNVIESQFRFVDGLISEQTDSCDARKWAAQAIGGMGGFLAGHSRLLRRWKARETLQRFLSQEHVKARASGA